MASTSVVQLLNKKRNERELRNRALERGMPVVGQRSTDINLGLGVQSKPVAFEISRSNKSSPASLQEIDTSNLHLTFAFKEEIEVSDIYETLKHYFIAKNDCDSVFNTTTYKALVQFYNGNRSVLASLGLFSNTDQQTCAAFKRLDGCAFTLNDSFGEMQAHCNDLNMLENDNESSSDSEEESSDSENESDVGLLFAPLLAPNVFNVQNDEDDVLTWMEEMQEGTLDDVKHYSGLLAQISVDVANARIILGNNLELEESVFSFIISQFQECVESEDVCIVRNLSMLLCNLVAAASDLNIKIVELPEVFEATLTVMKNWCPVVDQNCDDLCESQEVIKYCALAYGRMAETIDSPVQGFAKVLDEDSKSKLYAYFEMLFEVHGREEEKMMDY